MLDVGSWTLGLYAQRPSSNIQHRIENRETTSNTRAGIPFLLQSWTFKVGSSKFALQMGLNIQRPTSNIQHRIENREVPPNTRAGIPLSTSKLDVQSWKFEVRPPDGLEHPTSNFEPSN